jgi:integrase/recombinase XerD
MKLALAMERYVLRRRSDGSPFVSSELNLNAFCRWCGDIELSSLPAESVTEFLNSARCNAVTRVSKFSSIKCFVDYWSLRGQMPALDLVKPPKPQSVPGPFIYTRGQVKALLHAAEERQSRTIKLDSGTLRTMLLTLYATGCSVDEVFKLRRSDVDFKSKRICFQSGQVAQGRCIPIGIEFRSALMEYLSAKEKAISGDDPLFAAQSGKTLRKGYFYERFRSCNAIAGVNRRNDGRGAHPQDLRFSFAVHRISQCIRRAEDLNRLLPALSTYMGYSNLTKSEQFLAYAPDRFREDLRKLSPAKGSRHWRDNASLMDTLRRL